MFSIFKSTRKIKFEIDTPRILKYLQVSEAIFEQQFKILNKDYTRGDTNEYIKKPNANWDNPHIRQIQIELLLMLWDNRDALTGERFESGVPVHRHHYRILYISGNHIEFIKFDCRLQAQVPLSAASHAAVGSTTQARRYADRFKEAMEAWFNGEWYVPDWFTYLSDKKAFADHLRSLGFIEPK